MDTYSKFRKMIFFLIGLSMVFMTTLLFPTESSLNPILATYSLSALKDKTVLITSAGQSTDTYILQDIANELRLHNLFMPQATSVDGENTHSLIIVAGYSKVGLNLHNKTFLEEEQRVASLIEEAQVSKVPIITIYLGGKERRSSETDYLIQSLIPKSNYVITTYSGDHDKLLSTLAKEYNVPISIMNKTLDMTEPLASVFR